MRNLTNLECVALAHLWKIGPCTGHELRLAFAGSCAGRYSGSSGAIYPLLRRLEKSGYVASVPGRNGVQVKREISLTTLGRRAAKKWITSFDPRETYQDDPIRTRFQYLRMLTVPEQEAWLEAAIACIDEQDVLLREEYATAPYQNEVDKAVMRSVLESNRVRRRWLRRAFEAIRT